MHSRTSLDKGCRAMTPERALRAGYARSDSRGPVLGLNQPSAANPRWFPELYGQRVYVRLGQARFVKLDECRAWNPAVRLSHYAGLRRSGR